MQHKFPALCELSKTSAKRNELVVTCADRKLQHFLTTRQLAPQTTDKDEPNIIYSVVVETEYIRFIRSVDQKLDIWTNAKINISKV